MTAIGPSDAQVEYRLTGRHGCGASRDITAARATDTGRDTKSAAEGSETASSTEPATGVAATHADALTAVSTEWVAAGDVPPGGGDAAVNYRTDGSERPLLWVGQGLVEFGIEPGSVLTEVQFPLARRLMAGQHPHTGEQLVSPKLAVAPAAKLPAAPLYRAVLAEAQRRGVQPAQLFTDLHRRSEWSRLARAVERSGETYRMPVTGLGRIADVVGIAPAEAWGEQQFIEALEREGERVVVGNRGFDIGVDLPKSFSVLWAYADEELAGQLEQGFLDATRNTLGWLEPRVGYAMRGHHGDGHTARTIPTEGLLGWAMFHRTARPAAGAPVGDPHLHAHVTIANMAHAADGKWSTIGAGGRALYRHTQAIGELVAAQVRHYTSSELGIEWERHPRTRQWEIVGIPESTLMLFSKRHLEVRGLLIELGFDPDTAGRVHQLIAAAMTREAKPPPDERLTDVQLRAHYQAQALAAGEEEPELVIRRVLAPDLIPDPDRRVPSDDRLDPQTAVEVAEQVLDIQHGLTSHDKVFNRINLLAAIANTLPAGATISEIERLTDQVLALPDLIPMPKPETPGHLVDADRYTSRDIATAERTIFASARRRHAEGAAVVPARVAELALGVHQTSNNMTLSTEQREVLDRLLRAGHGVEAVVGVAGAGKTTLMNAARLAWQMNGQVVVGAATAAIAAHHLETESGIPAMTIAGWRHRIETTLWGLTGVDVLVIDEAGMTDDRDLAILTAEAEAKGVKLVGIGDPLQLRSPGVGGAFAGIHHLVEGHILSENRRQTNPLHRHALQAWRDRRYQDALRDLSQAGVLRVRAEPEQAMTALIGSWSNHRTGHSDPYRAIEKLVVLAQTNAVVDTLNHAIQLQRLADGELPADSYTQITTLGGEQRTFFVGDQVLIRTNDYRSRTREGHQRGAADVLNGTRGIITGIDGQGRVEVSWRDHTNTGEPVLHTEVLDREYVAKDGLRLGYAITVHKAQGLTVDGAVLAYLTGAEDANNVYVVASRHKQHLELYASHHTVIPESQRLASGATTPAEHHQLVQQALARRAADTGDDLLVTTELHPDLLHSITKGEPYQPHGKAGAPDSVDTETRPEDWLDTLEGTLADQLRHDPAWPALAHTLQDVADTGADPTHVLACAAGARELRTATSSAATLSWRLNNWLNGEPYDPYDDHAVWDEAAAQPEPAEAVPPATAARPSDTEAGTTGEPPQDDTVLTGGQQSAVDQAAAQARAAAAVTARPYGPLTDEELTQLLHQARHDADTAASRARTAARAADGEAEQAAAGQGPSARAMTGRHQRLTKAAQAINELQALDQRRDQLTAAAKALDQELTRHTEQLEAVNRRGRPRVTGLERDHLTGRVDQLHHHRTQLTAELDHLETDRIELAERAGPAHQHTTILAEYQAVRDRYTTDLQRAVYVDQQDAVYNQRQAALHLHHANRARKHLHQLKDEQRLRQSLAPTETQLERQAREHLRSQVPIPQADDASAAAEPDAAHFYQAPEAAQHSADTDLEA